MKPDGNSYPADSAPICRRSLADKGLSLKNLFPFHRTFLSILVAFLMLSGLNPVVTMAQTNPNEALWSDNGYSIKKVVSNTTIASGVNFSYTIIFSAPAGVSSVSIQDLVPGSLQVVSVTAAGPVCTVTPVLNTSGNTVTYNLTGLSPSCAPSGSFTIVVKFPEGTTCNGTTARNRAEILVNDKWQVTPFVSTTATAVDPWVVSKSIVSGAVVNPSGGSCGYQAKPGDTITYRLSVMKATGYYGNVVGQQNLSSAVVKDILPAGTTFVSSACATYSGGTVTWNVNSPTQLLDAANPWAYYWCDIKVAYPVGSFPIGTQILNQATLTGTTCNQPATHTSNQTCITVANIQPNANAYFAKYLALTNRVPGCSGYYYIIFCNNGNVPLTAFNVNDAVPSGITVNQVQIYGASATTTMNLNINSSPYMSGINNSYSSGTLTGPVNNLQFQMTGSLPVGACLYMYVYFTVNPNPTGTIVTNCATFAPLSNSLTLPNACVPFTVDAGTPNPCLVKDICSPQTSYDPGDIVRFRLRVQNIGSANITGAAIQDALHTNFTYVGNETYYVANTYNPPCSTGGSPPAGATAWSGVSPSHSGNSLTWNLPVIPSDCQLFYTAYCGYYGTWGLPYYYIEFDAKVDSFALPGVTPNAYSISGGNLSGTSTSNTVNILIVASFGQEVQKLLSTDAGVNYASSGTAMPGSTARYRLNYKNTSNVGVSSVRLIDLLGRDDIPNNKDWLIFNRSVPRGSQFDVSYIGNHATSLLPTAPSTPATLTWAAGDNICLPPYVIPGTCNPVTWGATPDRNVNMEYGTFVLAPNKNLREDFDVGIPANAPNSQKVCNDFAAIASANFLLNGNPQSVALTPVAAPPVCLTIDTTHVSASCCDSVKVQRAPGANGVIGCCANLTTTCLVKSIKVTVSNGTLSSVSWNCSTPIPTGYAGQSTYTFSPVGCIPSMNTCVDATTSGIVTLTYEIEFANGEKCQKKIELDCPPVPEDCCEGVKVEPVMDATGTKCCAKISTTCKVKAIDVTVTNGYLSSTSWNCTTPIPAGYIGQSSYTFAPNGCIVEMTNCVNPKQTGPVVINYVIYFENGEKCEKRLELKCEATSATCCDSVRVEPVHNADGTTDCCARITSTCKVKAVDVTVTNGTISSTSWNCGTLPSGFIGQSSFTFAPNGCVIDMTNCVKPTQSGAVLISYTIYFENGEKCEKKVEMDCKVTEETCCDKVKIAAIEGDGCCARIATDCEVKAIDVKITNGTIGSASWNCGTLPSGFIGQSSFTFAANNCAVDLKLCVNAMQNGPVTITYVILFANGEKCEKSIRLDCKVQASCCALVDFKLKSAWPYWKKQIGTFHVTNADPSTPICYIEISPSPAGSFTTGSLSVNGAGSAQSWSTTRIPSVGNISPSATNTIDFSIAGTSYSGKIKVCVVKCDGTRCCFEFNWNGLIITDVEVGVDKNTDKTGIVAVSISPVVKTPVSNKIKYVSFGFSDEKEAAENVAEFYAISASAHEGDNYPLKLASTVVTYMGKYNAFFELAEAKSTSENLGYFNLVFSKKLPKLGCTLYDEDGSILFTGGIDLSGSDVITSSLLIKSEGLQGNMFEFINLYPNPSEGSFKISYATGNARDVEIKVVAANGQLIYSQPSPERLEGIHNVSVNTNQLATGLYKVVLISEGEIRSKSLVIK